MEEKLKKKKEHLQKMTRKWRKGIKDGGKRRTDWVMKEKFRVNEKKNGRKGTKDLGNERKA